MYRSREQGFSLVELIVVLVIIGIIMGIAAISFSTWQRKAHIERQTRELLADFNTARTEALFRKKPHAIIMNPDAMGYVLRRYSSSDESRTSTPPAAEIVQRKDVKFQFSKENGNSIADAIFQFDVTGFTSTPGDNDTIRVNPTNSGAAFDCVVVSTSRTNIGHMSSGGSCDQN
jgi:type IV fimbrial biogenesis protein FimT